MKDENDTGTQDWLEQQELSEPQRGAPPMVGWWLCRRAGLEQPFTHRRWWSGTDWSIPVTLGVSDDDAVEAAFEMSVHRPDALEFCGLLTPALDYRYLLHANSTDEAFACDTADLVAQKELLWLAFYRVEIINQPADRLIAKQEEAGTLKRARRALSI